MTIGFKPVTPEEIFIQDKIPAREVILIGEALGFKKQVYAPQEVQQIRDFANAAKGKGLTIRQAIDAYQQVSAQQAPSASTSTTSQAPEGLQDGLLNVAGQEASERQRQLLAAKVAEAETDLVLGAVATNLARSRFILSGGDLSHRPDLATLLDQSQQILNQAEGSNPAALPLDMMLLEVFGRMPQLQAAVPALKTLALPVAA